MGEKVFVKKEMLKSKIKELVSNKRNIAIAVLSILLVCVLVDDISTNVKLTDIRNEAIKLNEEIATLNNEVKEKKETIDELQKKVGSLKYTYYSQDKIFKIGNNSIQSIPVDHCFDSHGCVCDIDGGWRIAYSGDRTITDHFTETVGSCDLLIHEATFTDDLLETALAKRHSTLSQAIQTGKDAHATFTVLTHFSQRYPKIPVFANELSNVAFAFDYMSFAFEDIDKLCKVCPKIFQMIQELEEKEDE